ncbi:alpha-ketoglutarate-dependent sulfonate dioxygenase [Phellopilus nigrolimitatus]|nr:alpha-ketoglutarate-dependent sulfonate dioxygenase [Phellopilus nigrolimitatus]
MAPVATEIRRTEEDVETAKSLKAKVVKPSDGQETSFNPFYSPPSADDDGSDDSYEYARYKPSFPKLDWAPLEHFEITDRGTFADPEKRALLSAAKKVTQLTPVIGTEIEGLDLSQLSDTQKDELALLVAERGVVFFRDQGIDIHQQLDLARHFGPLHKHATTPVPKEPGLEEVHLVYNDSSRRPDPSAFSKLELWHSDVTYELQPPSTTSLKGLTIPPVGGDTLFSSGYALYSSLSPGLQAYLEGLTAVHSAAAQAQGARAAGTHVRRPEIETVHPVVRVHPVTGWKSVYVNPGFTRRIVGVPKVESDFVLQFLFRQIGENPDFQVRFRWEKDSVAIWDNRVLTHSATFDFWPHRRHALRATPTGEKPLSVADYERKTGKKAKDRQQEVWKALGVADSLEKARNAGANSGPKGYND